MFKFSNSSLALGLVLAGGLTQSAGASASSASAFSITDLSQGYTLAAADQVKTSTEGKCGEDKFAKADANRDGTVSRAEFKAAVPERIAEFDSIDANRDGDISLFESEQYRTNRARKATEGKCGEGKCGAVKS